MHFIENMDLATKLAVANLGITALALVITIAGWIVVFVLGLSQQKKQLANSARMKAYESLHRVHQELNEQGITLGVLLGEYSLPFLQMSSTVFAPDKLSALNLWSDHVKKISKATSLFVDIYRKLWNESDMWMGAMTQVKKAKKELFEIHLRHLMDEIYAHIDFLQSQSVAEFDWTKWDQDEIKEKAKNVEESFNKVAIGYVDDYMGLVHNRLIGPIFNYQRIAREDFANLDKLPSYSILTEEGLEVITKK